MGERPTPDAVDALAHSLWTYGALSFKEEYECAYGLDEIPESQREAFKELARNILQDKNALPETTTLRQRVAELERLGKRVKQIYALGTLDDFEEAVRVERDAFVARADELDAERQRSKERRVALKKSQYVEAIGCAAHPGSRVEVGDSCSWDDGICWSCERCKKGGCAPDCTVARLTQTEDEG